MGEAPCGRGEVGPSSLRPSESAAGGETGQRSPAGLNQGRGASPRTARFLVPMRDNERARIPSTSFPKGLRKDFAALLPRRPRCRWKWQRVE